MSSGEGSPSGQHEASAERVSELERALKETISGIQAFQFQFERDLREYRSQRAWKLMVFFRRAYALLARGEWPGRPQVESYEPRFPDILDYLPGELPALRDPEPRSSTEDAAPPMVSVVIVTHNSAAYIGHCLDSVRRNSAYASYEVIVVDNGSRDGTADLLREVASRDNRVHAVVQANNAGFAAGSNLGARQAKGEYLILLNADTIVTEGWMERLIRHQRGDLSLGIVVPVTNWAGNEARINVNYTNLREMEDFSASLAREKMGRSLEIRVAPLFCALIPRPVWEHAGELDERFETGMFEDDDFSRRVLQAGFRIVCAEDCFVHHFGQGAFSKLPAREYQAIFARNRDRFEQKWGCPWTPHALRPGIRPETPCFRPDEFARL
jgi:GT2 family glycosyltransferase